MIILKNELKNWNIKIKKTYKSFTKSVKRNPRSTSTEARDSLFDWFERRRCINLSSQIRLSNSASRVGGGIASFGHFHGKKRTQTRVSEKHRKEWWRLESRERSIGGIYASVMMVSRDRVRNSVNERRKEKEKGTLFLCLWVCAFWWLRLLSVGTNQGLTRRKETVRFSAWFALLWCDSVFGGGKVFYVVWS